MIIGETFNPNSYYGYEEDSYDYLFKRKSKEERKQHRQEKKQTRQEKREEKKLQKQDPSSGGKRKPILGNFGLFDRNKNKKKTTGGTTSASSAKTEPGSSSESSSSEDLKTAATGAAATLAASVAGNEQGAGSENEKTESKELDKNGNPKKEAGFGPMLGFAFLGITILLAGVAIYKAGNKPLPNTSPLKVAA